MNNGRNVSNINSSEMLHHQFNYATPLSHFLNLHQSLQQQTQSQLVTNENSSSSNLSPSSPACDDIEPRFHHTKDMTAGVVNSSKSFTIAAILGLRQHDRNATADIDENSSTDLSAVMNLSMHAASAGNSNGTNRITASEFTRLSHPAAFAGHTGSSLTDSVSVTPVLHHHHHHHHHHQQQQQQQQQQQFNTTPSAIVSSNAQTVSVTNGNVNVSQGQTGSGGNSSSIAGSTCKKSSSKSKRVRTIFTPEQLERLEAEFERQQYMVGPERLYLAHTLQLTEAQVKVWFQNRRIKWRKHHLELTHQRLAAIKQQQQQLQQQLLSEVDNIADSSSSSCEAISGGGGPDDT